MEQKRFELSFYPITLDVLYDTTRKTYVQIIGGIGSPTSNPNAGTTCRDLRTGEILFYGIGEFDFGEFDFVEFGDLRDNVPATTLPREMRRRVMEIGLVYVTGKIVRR